MLTSLIENNALPLRQIYDFLLVILLTYNVSNLLQIISQIFDFHRSGKGYFSLTHWFAVIP